MKAILFFAMMVCAPALFAQAKTNKAAAAEQKAAGYTGHLLYTLPDSKTVNVIYSFAPLVPKEKLDFELHTPTPRPLWFQVTDKAGKVVKEWKPEEQVYHYTGTLDVSDLKPGAYTYRVFWNSNEIKSIPFNKK